MDVLTWVSDPTNRFFILLAATVAGTIVNTWINNKSRKKIQSLEIKVAVLETQIEIYKDTVQRLIELAYPEKH